MTYCSVLGLSKEPFSLSPDPAFFFRSYSHVQALDRLEIAIRLRRGLSLILGDVGVGKTTLARMLLSAFPPEDQVVFHIMLDPTYESEYQFLLSLCQMFGLNGSFKSTLDCREALEHCLFQRGVAEGKTTVLVVDEGQKMPLELLENLRVLLNYETNEYKLLQVVIFAQMELLPRIKRIRNLMDRVTLKYILNPLDEQETAELIQFRLEAAGLTDGRELFHPDAIRQIHRFTSGYPRKIAKLCQRALEELLMREQWSVDERLVRELIVDESRWIEDPA
jgi:general secretion pathway protein A